MHTEDNKAVVRRFFEDVINGSDLDRAGEFVTADYIELRPRSGLTSRRGVPRVLELVTHVGEVTLRPPRVPHAS
jgi:hypothetical protein